MRMKGNELSLRKRVGDEVGEVARARSLRGSDKELDFVLRTLENS